MEAHPYLMDLSGLKKEIKEEASAIVEDAGNNDHDGNMKAEPARIPLQKYCDPCLSQDSIRASPPIQHHRQGGDMIIVKVEVKEEPEDFCNGRYNAANNRRHPTTSSDDVFAGSPKENPPTATPRLVRHPEASTQDGTFPTLLCPITHHRSPSAKLFSCSECGKSFPHKAYLVMHERVHTREKPYPCPECGKSFSTKSNLIRHEKGHAGEKPYSCSECGKCFGQKSDLVTHARVHTGEKPYACSKCEKCFSSSSNLSRHDTVHVREGPRSCFNLLKAPTGEKPYQCSECGKCFSQRSDLITHGRVHAWGKPFSCSYCAKCFSQKSDLITHERIHTGEKPFSCSECGKCFASKSNHIRHERAHRKKKAHRKDFLV